MVNAFVVYFVFSGSDFLGLIFSLTEAGGEEKAKLWNLSGIWPIIFNFSNLLFVIAWLSMCLVPEKAEEMTKRGPKLIWFIALWFWVSRNSERTKKLSFCSILAFFLWSLLLCAMFFHISLFQLTKIQHLFFVRSFFNAFHS